MPWTDIQLRFTASDHEEIMPRDLICGRLVGFYGISTIVGYLMLNLLYIYIYIYIYIYDL